MAILSETAIAVFGNRTRLHTKKINKKRLSPTYLPKKFLHVTGNKGFIGLVSVY